MTSPLSSPERKNLLRKISAFFSVSSIAFQEGPGYNI